MVAVENRNPFLDSQVRTSRKRLTVPHQFACYLQAICYLHRASTQWLLSKSFEKRGPAAIGHRSPLTAGACLACKLFLDRQTHLLHCSHEFYRRAPFIFFSRGSLVYFIAKKKRKKKDHDFWLRLISRPLESVRRLQDGLSWLSILHGCIPHHTWGMLRYSACEAISVRSTSARLDSATRTRTVKDTK